ncbi:MAG TPA: AAA family ATPase [Rhodanobacteraceae bacterium]|nr:AAA family ATPase [Rhodanobacteraceae bacterium]
MSIVEKAAEKLKTSQPEPQAFVVDEATASAQSAPTLERLQERMRVVDEPADTAPLLHVDQLRLERAGLSPVEDDAAGRLEDELRRVKRPLLDNVSGKSDRVPAHAERIVVSSAVPGEGKTFTAVNLALSFAREPDFEVLLVDGDIPKSDVTRVLGLEGRPGLMDLLVDERRPIADVILRTDIPNLLVVPSGHHHPLASELFGGRHMEYVLDALAGPGRRRLVVFDSSPLLATSESQVLASHMGQVVMVVAAGRTRRLEVESALQCLNGSSYVGLILNKSRLPASENHHYGYYGYYSRSRDQEV